MTIGGEVYGKVELLTLFATPPAGDASLILAHQLIAAMLNHLTGAASAAGIAEADAWMAANKDADGRLPYGTTDASASAAATALADGLASYNEGSVGPAHCDDGPGTTTTASSGADGSGASGAGGSGATGAEGTGATGGELIPK